MRFSRRGGRVGSFTLIVVATAVLAGCGGSSGSEHHSRGRAATTPATTTGTTTGSAQTGQGPSETVQSGGGSAASQASVRSGTSVLFQTKVPGAQAATPVTLRIDRGPNAKLSVTAQSGGHSSTAVLTSSTGKPITLTEVHFACFLKPQPSFCPAHHVNVSASSYSLVFNVSKAAPLVIGATVGPTKLSPRSVPAHAKHEPPYVPIELARTAAAGAGGKPAPLSASVSVKPKQFVTLFTRIFAPVKKGAPQPVTVTFDAGPAKTLTASATVSGGKTSTAKLRSADGKPVALALARYYCFLKPWPNFCPGRRQSLHGGRYSVTFSASPLTPISILAVVKDG